MKMELEDIAKENLKDPNFLFRIFGGNSISYTEAKKIIRKEFLCSGNSDYMGAYEYAKRWYKLAELHGLQIN